MLPITQNEAERIAALHATYLLDTEPEEIFDRITRLARHATHAAAAMVSLVDQDRQWFKARCGLSATQTSREVSFCSHGLLKEEPFVVPDTFLDERFCRNPLVIGEPYIRAYAGVPIHSPDRSRIGMLCVTDSVPRNFVPEEIQALQDLARSTEELIHQRQLVIAASSLLESMHAYDRKEGCEATVADTETSRSQEVKQQLESLVMHDMLTGLPNRAKFISHIDHASAHWQQQNSRAIVACIDLDRFKQLNETFGHSVGDQVLIAISTRLAQVLRQHDVVARIGGDEFVVLISGVYDEASAHVVLERILRDISLPILAMQQEIMLSASIGYSRFPNDGADADTLLNSASMALRFAKQYGGDQIRQYENNLFKPFKQRFTIESQLRRALEREELLLHYQPKIALSSGGIVGIEALVRWNNAELGMVSPAEFIPVAEETGLIVPIGEWIMQTACEQILRWRSLGIAPVPVAINLSSRQFNDNRLVEKIEGILQSTNLPGSCLELELTESVSMDSPEKSAEIMAQIRALGISVSIDDFGTGYSSLSYLKRLPIDKIKIDRSFIADMTQSQEALAIVQAIIAMAHRLHLRVVAEGVETRDQQQSLVANGCDEMQGYYFSKPLRADECGDLLAKAHMASLCEQRTLAL